MRLACPEQRPDEGELRLRRRPDGREDRTISKFVSLTGVQRASLSAAIWEDFRSLLERRKAATDKKRVGALVNLLGLRSRVEKARTKKPPSAIVLIQGLILI